MKYFGTDGVRGVANRPPITPAWILRLARAAAEATREAGSRGPVVLGRDPRRSGEALACAAAAGLAGAGAEVLDGGVLPTPAVSYLVRELGGALGVVLSASHNPAGENGIKFFGPDGGKLPPALEARMEELVEEERPGPEGAGIGRVRPYPKGRARYIDHVVAALAPVLDFGGERVVIDAAHGAASATAPQVLKRLGAEVLRRGCRPDGMNINAGVGALHPEGLAKRVRSRGACLGIALDGDADRVMLVDETGAVLDGDDILFLLARGRDPRPRAVVGTVMSNHGLVEALGREGVELVRAPVGDRHVKEAMDRVGSPYGAEPSGHVILVEHGPTGDGLLSGLAAAAGAGLPGRPLSRARGGWARMPQVLLNVPVGSKPPLDEVPGYPEELARVEETLGEGGRVLVRYSGTESKVRVMVEAADDAVARDLAGRLANHLERTLA